MGEDSPTKMEVEVLPSAALAASEAERASLMRAFEERRTARAMAVPTAEADLRAGLRSFGLPIRLFGEDLHDRRERLRAAMAVAQRAGLSSIRPHDWAEAKPEAGDDDDDDTDDDDVDVTTDTPAPPAAPVEEEYYVEGTAELRALRLTLAMPSLQRARHRLQAERDLRASLGAKESVKAAFQAAEAKTVERARGAFIVASQVGDTRPLSCISMGPRPSDSEASVESLVATGSWSGVVKLWDGDVDAKQLQTLEKHTARVSSVSLPREKPGVLLTSSADATAHMFVSRDGVFCHEAAFGGHSQRVSDCRLHPIRHSLVVTASFDGTFILHDNGSKVLTQRTGHEQVYRTAIHPDGSLLATCGTEGGIRLWDLRSGRAVMTMAKAHVGSATCIDFSGDGRVLASGGGDNVVKIWDLRGKRCLRSIPAHTGLVSCVRFCGGGGDVLVSGSFDRSVKLWAARRDWTMLKAHTGHEDKVTSLDCSGDARKIVSACYDKTWKVWGSGEDIGICLPTALP
jgi:U4/U6 small nuclear ribonucleoprotein PRP4